VDTVKFQSHLADPCTEWRVRPVWAKVESRQDYWKRTGFSEQEWTQLAFHCVEAGVEFLCSPFGVKAVAQLDPLVTRWKIPSGRIADMDLLDAIGRTGKPVLLSTGMGNQAEIGHAQTRLTASGCPVQLMQCVTAYPCPPEQIGLPLAAKWGGLSDHSGMPYVGIAAAALGCKVLEVHVCWSREQGGFDTAASLTTAELADLVRGIRFVEKALRPVDKDKASRELEPVRHVFMQH
jgi:N,N'-diacetyllegionaminate synthase